VCKQQDKTRSFNIPGGKGVKVFVASVGLIVSGLAFVVSFFPPSSLPGDGGSDSYVELLVISFIVVLALPFIVYGLHDKRGKTTNARLVPIRTHTAPKGYFFMHPRARSPHHVIIHDENKPIK
jgi:hypothetical protein